MSTNTTAEATPKPNAVMRAIDFIREAFGGMNDDGDIIPDVGARRIHDDLCELLNDGGPASEMSVRDWFAGQALAFLAHPARVGVSFDPKGDAEFAYAIADAMLAARIGAQP